MIPSLGGFPRWIWIRPLLKTRSLYLWISTLALLLALAAFFYLGTFTRLYADDFCIAGDVLHLGLFGMLVKWYGTWTGRFVFIFSAGLFSLAGPKFAGLAPILIGVFWLFGLWCFFFPLLKHYSWPRPRLLALLAAGLVLLVLLSSIPNFFQPLFWENGLVNYTLPLLGFTFTGGILLRAWLGVIKFLPAALGLFLLAFISGGFTESFAAMQVSLFVLIILFLVFSQDRAVRARFLPLVGLALLGGLAAMLIVVIAPGNTIRLQYAGGQTANPNMLRVVTFSLRNMTHIFGKYLLVTPLWALASILPPFLAGWLFTDRASRPVNGWTIPYLWKQSWLKGVILTGIAAIGLVTAACAPVVFALNAYPDDRTIIVPQLVIVMAAVGTSAMAGAGLHKIGLLPDPSEKVYLSFLLQGAIVAVLLFAAGMSILRSIQMVPDLQSAARIWDTKNELIRQAIASGQETLEVDGGNSLFGLPDLGDDPNNWINKCAADYYGVRQIIGR